jgi:hypothetical protein
MKSKLSIEQRISNENYQLWYKFYRDIINRYPELLDSEILNDPNEISKYFIYQLSRKSIIFKKILSSSIADNVRKIFGTKINSNFYYYHMDISKEYDNERINYSFESDFIMDIILKITSNNKSKYWYEINNKVTNLKYLKDIKKSNSFIYSNKINSKILDILKIEDKENIISQYAKINSNVCIIMIVLSSLNENYYWLDNKLISNIFYQKEFTFNGNILKNILFDIVQNYSYDERIKKLNNIYSDITDYKIKIIFYKTIIDSQLKSNYDDIYIFSDTNVKIRALSILLNSNTLKKFINQEIIFIPEKQNKLYSTLNENSYFIKNMLLFQSLKKWIYNNYDGNEIDNIIVSNSFELSDKKITQNFILIDTNYFSKEKYEELYTKKLIFIDLLFTYMDITKEQEFIVDNIHDPKHYYQLDGIKFFLH